MVVDDAKLDFLCLVDDDKFLIASEAIPEDC